VATYFSKFSETSVTGEKIYVNNSETSDDYIFNSPQAITNTGLETLASQKKKAYYQKRFDQNVV
jgi:hypothetical protein